MNEIKYPGVLVFDIESANPYYGCPTEQHRLRLFACYSFDDQKSYMLYDPQEIRDIIDRHKYIVSFMGVGTNHKNELIPGYDCTVMYNSGYNDIISKGSDELYRFKGKTNIDIFTVFKKRAGSIKIKEGMLGDLLMSYSLDFISKTIRIVNKDEEKIKEFDYSLLIPEVKDWTPENKQLIEEYTQRDIDITVKMYSWIEEYFESFKEYLNDEDIDKKKYLTCSIASFVYKSVCNALGFKEEYSDEKIQGTYKGAVVFFPAGQEFHGTIWALDFKSLYPHMLVLANLFSPVEEGQGWHGNEMFKPVGTYNDKERGKIENFVLDVYNKRVQLKAENSPKEYSAKIFLNCFAENTQIYTPTGEKNIKDCQIGELVYSINPKSKELEIKPIIGFEKEMYNGVLHNWKGNYLDFNVTPKHKFLLKDKKTCYFKESKDITDNEYIPKTKCTYKNQTHANFSGLDKFIDCSNLNIFIKPHILHGRTWMKKHGFLKINHKYNQYNRYLVFKYNDIQNKLKNFTDADIKCKYDYRRYEDMVPFFYNTIDMFSFFGWVISEGSTTFSDAKIYNKMITVDNKQYTLRRGKNYITDISQYYNINKINCDEIKNLLTNMKVKFSQTSKNTRISSKIIFDLVQKNCGIGSVNKYFSNNIKNGFTKQTATALFTSIFKGDGTKNSSRYTTKSDRLKQDYIELILNLGATFTIKNDGCWRISNTFNNNYISKYKNRRDKQYNGYIYKINVADNHTLLAGSNGRFNWIGQSLYGCTANPVFKNVYNKTTAADCTYLGRTCIKFARKTFIENGYKILAGDTDSNYLLDPYDDERRLIKVRDHIVNTIKKNMPLPSETFGMEIDAKITDMFFTKPEKPKKKIPSTFIDEEDEKNSKLGFLKKNYIYRTTDGKVVYKGMGVKKKSSPEVCRYIFKNILLKKISEERVARFSETYLQSLITNLLKKDMSMATIRYACKPVGMYASESNINAQISKVYGPGIHFLIPVKKDVYADGKLLTAGMSKKYISLENFQKLKLKLSDINMESIYSGLAYFIKDSQTSLAAFFS